MALVEQLVQILGLDQSHNVECVLRQELIDRQLTSKSAQGWFPQSLPLGLESPSCDLSVSCESTDNFPFNSFNC